MNNALQVINISGIDCYEKDGVAYLKLETVARGLGFTQTQMKNGKEYVSVRWETVFRYLDEIGFPNKLGKDDFIPENVFYRLAMKAKNEAAEAFQAKIADEVIPTIRKTGSYNAKPMTSAELFAMQAKINLEQEQRLSAMETRQDELSIQFEQNAKRMDNLAAAWSAPFASGDNWQESANHSINAVVQHFGLNHQKFRHDLYEELERTAGVDLQQRLTRLQNRMASSGATATQRKGVNKLTIVAQDKKLRAIFESILRCRVTELNATRPA